MPPVEPVKPDVRTPRPCPMCGRRPNQHLREFMDSPKEPVELASFVAGARAVWERLGDAQSEEVAGLRLIRAAAQAVFDAGVFDYSFTPEQRGLIGELDRALSSTEPSREGEK